MADSCKIASGLVAALSSSSVAGPTAHGQPSNDHGGQEPAYPKAVAEMKRSGNLWRFSRLRQCKYSTISSSRITVESSVWPVRGSASASVRTARRTLAGYEATTMIRKEQVHNIGGRDMRAQGAFVTALFEVAA